MFYRRLRTVSAGLIALVGILNALSVDAQTVSPAYSSQLRLEKLPTLSDSATQIAWGPDGRLYFRLLHGGVDSYAYDKGTGVLSDLKHAAFGFPGIGLAFHRNNMYLTTMDSSIVKLNDQNGNGVWGEPGELSVRIATQIPTGDHNLDQLLVQGDALYVGIGTRTTNGYSGDYTAGSFDDYGGQGFYIPGGIGKTWGDSAYNGTISWIQDLNAVLDVEGSANAYADPTLTESLIKQNDSPLVVSATNKLIVHSGGTRNPYGLCFDRSGELWFTNNFNRNKTNGNGTVGFGYLMDQLGPDFSMDVHDQLFHAARWADYGFANVNWRARMTALGFHSVTSTTFDNLFNPGPYVLTNPAEPDGLGPSSSSNGCGFFYAKGLPAELTDRVFVARFNGPITESAPGTDTLDYRDIVAVDTANGNIRRVASGFVHPLALFWDGAQRLLISSYPDNALFALVAIDNTSTKITVTNLTDAAGHAVTLKALLQRSADGAALGGKTVTFKIDGTNVGSAGTRSDGSAGLRYRIPAGLGAGDHVITATFAGDNTYGAATGTGSLSVYFTTALTLNDVQAAKGETVALHALLRRDPDGVAVPGKNITFKVDDTIVGTAVTASDGSATVNYAVPATMSSGGHPITAVFAGDPAYHGDSSNAQLKVERQRR